MTKIETLPGERLVGPLEDLIYKAQKGVVDLLNPNHCKFARAGFTLYLHPCQRFVRINGLTLKKHLREAGIMDRSRTLESSLVRGWQANPETYPEELKGIFPFLWGSIRDRAGCCLVPCLEWSCDQVIVRWGLVHNAWGKKFPALLANLVP